MCKCKDRKLERCINYDSYYCSKCGEWQEDRCNDGDCQYCKYRPAMYSLEIKEDGK